MSEDLRRVLHSAYTLVRSIETTKAINTWTLDHMIQDQITRLKSGSTRAILDGAGESVGDRTSRYDDLTELQNLVDKAVKAVKDAGDDSDNLASLGIIEVVGD